MKIAQIPSHLVIDATDTVVKDWKFYGCINWRNNESFLDGIVHGYRSQPEPAVSETEEPSNEKSKSRISLPLGFLNELREAASVTEETPNEESKSRTSLPLGFLNEPRQAANL